MYLEKVQETKESPTVTASPVKQELAEPVACSASIPEIKFNLMESPAKGWNEKDLSSPVKNLESPALVKEVQFNMYSPTQSEEKRPYPKSEKKEPSTTREIHFSLFSTGKKERVISEYQLSETKHHHPGEMREEQKAANEGIGQMSDFDDYFENTQLAGFDYFNINRREEDYTEVAYAPTT